MTDTGPAQLTRRSVVVGALAVGGAAALAACGADEAPTPTTSPDAAPPESPDGEAEAPAAGGDVLVPVADVPVGSGVIVAGAGVVVTQPTDGEFKGFSSACTHQGCQVSSVDGESIVCACHGSRFSVVDGSVQAGPATAPLAEVAVAVDGDDVTSA
jgi:Rieske Fe-S protein